MISKRKIMVVTGTRAEYGLLKNIIKEIQDHQSLDLKLVVTGTHLSKKHGYTIDEIKADGFPIAHEFEILDPTNDQNSIITSMALAMNEFSKVYSKDRPDILLILGDRYEVFAAATAALVVSIPIAHIHGGELTFGAIDDAFRHSITKMAWWHFASTEVYKKRIIKLGESPERVFNVGAPAVDALESANASQAELEEYLGIKMISPVVLATFHPETLSPGKNLEGLQIFLKGLKSSGAKTVIFTKANADAEGDLINSALESFVQKKEIINSILVSSLGHRRYLSLLRFVDVAAGNSSSLVIEAPMVGTPSVNIGQRQDGRVKGPSVIDVAYDSSEISNSLSRSWSAEFKASYSKTDHPFGKPNVAKRIVKTLITNEVPKSLIKGFYE